MTTNTIIQSARFNSTDTPSNSEWVTNLAVPAILNQGDSISVRQAYIDSRLNSSGNIVIERDTELSLTYYFYYMFPCDGASKQRDPIEVKRQNPRDFEDFGAFDAAYESPVDFVLWTGTHDIESNRPLQIYQGAINDYATNTGTPQNPLYPNYLTPAQINQSMAMEVPMLLVESQQVAPPAVTGRPITKTWTYTLPAGSYNPSELADLLTKKMAEVQIEKKTPSFNPYQQVGTTTATNINNFLIQGTQVAYVESSYELNSGDQAMLVHPYVNDNLVPTKQLLFSSNSPEFADKPLNYGYFANFCTDISFNPQYFNPNMNALLNVDQFVNPLVILPSHFTGEYVLTQNQSGGSGKQTIRSIAGLNYASPLVGASEISIEYNQTLGIFQFTYMHTPLLQLPLSSNGSSGTQPVEVVKIIKTDNVEMYNDTFVKQPTGEVKICEQTRHSGIFFQSMEPASFWSQIMGFDVPNITFPEAYVWGDNRKMTFEQFNKITTSGYVGIENNFNFTDSTDTKAVVPNLNAPSYLTPMPAATQQDGVPSAFEETYSNLLNSSRWFLEHFILINGSIFQTDGDPFDYYTLIGPNFYEEYSSALIATNPLYAIQAPLSQISSTGHYLINIDGYKNTKNDFINSDDIYNIKSIVSTYYLSQGAFATQPFSDTAIYVHNSPVPKVIDSFRVRLIDPINMKNALNIGPNSSVYLQINKIISEEAILQTS